MDTVKPVGLIKCGARRLEQDNKTGLDKAVSKIYYSANAESVPSRNHFPNAEVVPQKELILQDAAIDHVIIYSPAPEDMQLVAEVLKAGKKVQIIGD